MRLIKPSYEILFISPKPLELIELAGRTCYKSEAKITEGSAAKFVKMIIKRGHLSVIEHPYMTVRFICDRGITHEIVRHRLASYSQESTRYCNYSGGVTFIIPHWIKIDPTDMIIEKGQIIGHRRDYDPTSCWLDCMLNAERCYTDLITAAGWSPQQARSVLPNSLKTEIVMTANFREWMQVVFKLRTSNQAHSQMRELMIPLLKQVKETVPVIFDDIEIKE